MIREKYDTCQQNHLAAHFTHSDFHYIYDSGCDLGKVCGCYYFVLACATDPLDGYFARSRKEVSTLGTFLDPLADKLLTMSAFIVLVKYQLVGAWMVTIIIGREVAITGLRAIISQQMGDVLSASRWGKLKTLAQMIGGSILLFMMPTGDVSREVSLVLPPIANIIMTIILATTVWSGWLYIRQYKEYFIKGS